MGTAISWTYPSRESVRPSCALMDEFEIAKAAGVGTRDIITLLISRAGGLRSRIGCSAVKSTSAHREPWKKATRQR